MGRVYMNFIIVSNKSGRHHSFNANLIVISGLVLAVLTFAVFIGFFTYRYLNYDSSISPELVVKWKHEMEVQRRYVERLKQDAQLKHQASALRIAQLQARIVRLDALGERLTKIGRLNEGEFDFSGAPAMGGPEKIIGVAAYKPPSYMELLDQLARDIEDREQQLGVLQILMAKQKMDRDKFIAGRPVKKGWMSSRYGSRVDPITGKRAWHEGVDFAGKEGADVIAVAAGVVVFAGERSGYGRMIEIKNVVSREITGIPKMEYWIQMQLQMEVCDLNECDFLETKFIQYSNEEEYREDNEIEYKGIINELSHMF